MNDEVIGAIKERLENSKNIVIASHIRPDGDAVG
jgi:nanoRNase/pAp phosphatase (c-di-AMP/oligoRNAs hydrolase)